MHAVDFRLIFASFCLTNFIFILVGFAKVRDLKDEFLEHFAFKMLNYGFKTQWVQNSLPKLAEPKTWLLPFIQKLQWCDMTFKQIQAIFTILGLLNVPFGSFHLTILYYSNITFIFTNGLTFIFNIKKLIWHLSTDFLVGFS